MTIEDSSWIHPELNDIVNDIVWLSASRHFFPWVSAHQLANTSVKNVGRVQIINHSLVWWARLSFLGNYLRLNNIKIQPSLKLELLGQDVQIPIKLTQDKRNFELSFVTLQWGFLHIVWPSVLSLIKIHKTKVVKNICIQEKFITRKRKKTAVTNILNRQRMV